MVTLNNDWDALLAETFAASDYRQLRAFLKNEYGAKTVYPPMHDIFNALRYTAYAQVKVVIAGQDPYINPGEAHGMAFSVQTAAKIPPSLQNIFKELSSDVGCAVPDNGYLVPWAEQGVLLLNNVLTVEAGRSRSHAGKGWERFTDRVISLLNEKNAPVVFLLWGRDAQMKCQHLNNPAHLVLTAAHPSPLAGGRFFGCRHFSKANAFLEKHGITPVDWQIPNVKGVL
jgi:uracil-DNA glycosylase